MKFTSNDKCNGCGACVRDCPVVAIELASGRAQMRSDREALCLGCQHCVAICPLGAAALGAISARDCRPAMPVQPIDGLLRSRRSIRQFRAEDLPRTEIDELLETLKYVPTGCNVRHLTFKVVNGRERMQELLRATVALLKQRRDNLPEFLKSTLISAVKHPETDPFFRHAPHLLIVAGSPQAVTPQYDCVAACAYFDLLAQSRGVGTCWCGFLKIILDAVPEAAGIFGLSAGTPCYGMLFGRPATGYHRSVDRRAGAQVEYW